MQIKMIVFVFMLMTLIMLMGMLSKRTASEACIATLSQMEKELKHNED